MESLFKCIYLCMLLTLSPTPTPKPACSVYIFISQKYKGGHKRGE